ncbi:mCG145932, partial [Mus musculus]
QAGEAILCYRKEPAEQGVGNMAVSQVSASVSASRSLPWLSSAIRSWTRLFLHNFWESLCSSTLNLTSFRSVDRPCKIRRELLAPASAPCLPVWCHAPCHDGHELTTGMVVPVMDFYHSVERSDSHELTQ